MKPLFICMIIVQLLSINGLKLRRQITGCRIDNQSFQLGQEFTHDNVIFQCTKDGLKGTGCIAGTKTLSVGEEIVDGNVVKSCKLRGFNVQYAEWPADNDPLGFKAAPINEILDNFHGQNTANAPKSEFFQTNLNLQPVKMSKPCVVNGVQHKPGDEYIDNRFKVRCTDSGVEIMACLSSKGEEVVLGQTIRTSDYEKQCIVDAKGDVKYQERTLVGGFSRSNRPALQPDTNQPPGGHGTSYWEIAPESFRGKMEGGKCVQNGKTFNVGEEWHDERKLYKYRCNADGLKPVACIADNLDEMPAGTTDILSGLRRDCRLSVDGQTLRYKQEHLKD